MATKASGSGDPDNLAAMMKELGLSEEDLDDVIFDEKEVLLAEPRWIALARHGSSETCEQLGIWLRW